MVVKNTLNTWDGSEWKAPNVREAEANQQAQQNAALAATAQLLQQMMDNNFANNRALQDGVAGNVTDDLFRRRTRGVIHVRCSRFYRQNIDD